MVTNRNLKTPGPRRGVWPLLWVAVLAGLVLTACATNRGPRFNYGPDGEPVQFKRYEKHLAKDYFWHFTPIAFKRADAMPLDPLLSDDQKNVLNEQGKPEYVRENYRADSNEIVTDWAFVSKRKIYQFIEGQVVYQGDLSDYDEMLIRRGRPDFVKVMANKDFGRTDLFTYKDWITHKTDQYGFKNGVLAGRMWN